MTLPDGVEEAIRHRYTDESKALVILEFLSGLPSTTVQEWMQAQGIQLKPANTVENIPLVEQADTTAPGTTMIRRSLLEL